MIAGPADLGVVTALWKQPQRYAQFLGQELRFVYAGTLIVVMPNGYGVARAGRPAPALRRRLAGLGPPGRDGVALVAGGTAAATRLAAGQGLRLTAAGAAATKSTKTRDRLLILGAVLAALALLGAHFLERRLRRERAARRESGNSERDRQP